VKSWVTRASCALVDSDSHFFLDHSYEHHLNGLASTQAAVEQESISDVDKEEKHFGHAEDMEDSAEIAFGIDEEEYGGILIPAVPAFKTCVQTTRTGHRKKRRQSHL
jgi:hypothetical protein